MPVAAVHCHRDFSSFERKVSFKHLKNKNSQISPKVSRFAKKSTSVVHL
jgi:hypothetical protein